MEGLNQQKKAKMVGRPNLPKGQAKARIVPVRFKASDLKLMSYAAKASQQPLSRWIRFTIKNALKRLNISTKGGSRTMMGTAGTTYEQQVEAGKKIVREMLAKLRSELNEPRVNVLEFKVTDQDFDYDRISLVDPKRFNVVLKIEEDDLADCPADSLIRRNLEAALSAAIRSYFARKP